MPVQIGAAVGGVGRRRAADRRLHGVGLHAVAGRHRLEVAEGVEIGCAPPRDAGDVGQAAPAQRNRHVAQPGLHLCGHGTDQAAQAGAMDAEPPGIDLRTRSQPGCRAANIKHGLTHRCHRVLVIRCQQAETAARRSARSVVRHLHEQRGNSVLGKMRGNQARELLISSGDIQHDYGRKTRI